MINQDVQAIVDMVVKAATKAAMTGHPVERIIWCPPVTPTQDWRGSMALIHCPLQSPSIPPTWEQ